MKTPCEGCKKPVWAEGPIHQYDAVLCRKCSHTAAVVAARQDQIILWLSCTILAVLGPLVFLNAMLP